LPATTLWRSITSANVRTAAASLLIACVALVALQFVSLRKALLEDVSAQASLVGTNSAAALMFSDRKAAEETLAALKAIPYVENAAVFNALGVPLAVYGGEAGTPYPLLETPQPARGHRFEAAYLVIVQPIDFEGQRVGTVLIRATLKPLYLRLTLYAVLTLLVAMGALGVTLPLVARMQRDVMRAEAHLDYLAYVDPVTGLPNRHAFNDRLRAAVEKTAASRSRVALILLDLDNFKVVNDTLGHEHGDRLLKAIAQGLVAVSRRTDVVFRIGGDEFAVILTPLDSAQDAMTIARQIMERLARPLLVGTQEIYVTASVGTSLSPDDGIDIETLMRNADTAMYYAKHNGKNACVAFRQDMNQRTQHRLALERDLHRALERKEFEVHYQPQIDIRDRRIVGVEALLRWNRGGSGFVSPAEFIPVAEECGLIVPIGRWVLRMACRQAAAWRDAGLVPILMSVNVSVRQLRQEHLLPDVVEALRESGLSPEQLELEITESMLMETVDASTGVLQRVRDEGVRVAIDDFGTGYSSLSYLPTLPINRLKIDRSFVRRIPGDGQAITTAILALAQSFDLSVVAEGVEEDAQVDFLRRAGCHLMQGWHFAPAMPAEEISRLLASHGDPDLVSTPSARRA
jgi:diguanylate cyclase (GGDEF)-like protein